jgi:hypothetical protein
VTSKEYQAFFKKHGMTQRRFTQLASDFSFMDRELGNQLYEVLQDAGYEGNIDDFWMSVFGKQKPSIPTAFIAPPEARRESGVRPWWVGHGVKIIHTGQTRKSGSH